MNNLAFVLFTILGPSDWAGEQFITIQPEECGPYMDRILPLFKEAGWEVMAQCQYTSAPITSPRPQPRTKG